jgi:hypothetical protein
MTDLPNVDLDYDDALVKQRTRNEARHILKKIKDARGAPGDAGIRWPFELLQNALDGGARPGADGVAVELEQRGNRFAFTHDGALFSGEDLAALVSGGSSKEFDSPSKTTTGRYGTSASSTQSTRSSLAVRLTRRLSGSTSGRTPASAASS